MSAATKSKSTVTVILKKGTEFTFESPEAHKIEGTALLLVVGGNTMRFALDTVKTVRVGSDRLDRATEELIRLYFGPAAFRSPSINYSYDNTSFKW